MPNKINVALLLGSNKVGGMERQASFLAKGLSEDDEINLTVFFNDNPIKRNIFFAKKINFSSISYFWLFDSKYTWRYSDIYFVRKLKKEKVNVIVAYNYESIAKVVRCSKFLHDVKIIGNIRGTRFAFDDFIGKQYREVCQHVDHVVCNCWNTRDLLIGKQICNPEIITVINNGIKINSKHRIKKTDEKFKILFAASLSPVKDPLCFANVVCLVMEKFADIDVIIAGDGICKKEMVDVFANAGLIHRVKFLGKVAPDDVPYNEADLVVSSSLREASSNTILEALSNGVPVVATAVGGTINILKNKSFARLVPPQDKNSLSDAIIGFYKIPKGKYISMGKDAVRYVEAEYSLQKMIAKYRKLFTRIAAR